MDIEYHGVLFQQSFPAVSLAAIKKAERQLKTRLPDEYRNFLLNVNGGVPSQSEFTMSGSDHRACIDFLYGLDSQRDTNDLLHEQQSILERTDGIIPVGFVTIGFDPGNAPYFLSTQGGETGLVYLYDPDGFLAHDRKPRLHVAAVSFVDLLERLASFDGEV